MKAYDHRLDEVATFVLSCVLSWLRRSFLSPLQTRSFSYLGLLWNRLIVALQLRSCYRYEHFFIFSQFFGAYLCLSESNVQSLRLLSLVFAHPLIPSLIGRSFPLFPVLSGVSVHSFYDFVISSFHSDSCDFYGVYLSWLRPYLPIVNPGISSKHMPCVFPLCPGGRASYFIVIFLIVLLHFPYFIGVISR